MLLPSFNLPPMNDGNRLQREETRRDINTLLPSSSPPQFIKLHFRGAPTKIFPSIGDQRPRGFRPHAPTFAATLSLHTLWMEPRFSFVARVCAQVSLLSPPP